MSKVVLAKDVILIHPREIEISKLVAKGMSNKEIAKALGVSDHTVQNALRIIFRKLGIRSRSEMLPVLLKNRLIAKEEL